MNRFLRMVVLSLAAVCLGCRSGSMGGGSRLGAGEPGWIPLFDGRTLGGWTVKCRSQDRDKHYWQVENGALTAQVPKGSQHQYIWLMNTNTYGDFELKLKVQTYGSDAGNSGIQVRSRYDDAAGWLDGPQVDINPPDPWRCGFLYDETREVQQWLSPLVGPPSMAKPEHAPKGWKWFQADQWNDVRITCRGTRIRTVINGLPVVDYEGAGQLDNPVHRARGVGLQGHIFLQIHPGGPLTIRFKDIWLKKL